MGEVVMTCAKSFTNQQINSIVPNGDVDPDFLYYSFVPRKQELLSLASAIGVRTPILNKSAFCNLRMMLPPIATQRKIAATLSAYDDLIENNTQRIKILEEMAQALYREWFVRFRFPGHEKVKMVDSPMGKIPEEWEVKKLGEVLELAYGKALKADNRVPGNISVYGSGGIVGYHNQALVKGPGIIVGRKGNVGSIFWSNDDFFPIDTVFYVQTKHSLYYILYNLKHQNFVNNDAAVPGLNRSQAYHNEILVPPADVLSKFQNFVEHLFKQIYLLNHKCENLRRTRDLLLPKLISGELSVENLEIKTEG
jgi:type I restriction enzyme S subunit